MSTLDELFKEKLADHTTPPSADVWQKVEGNLSKKNNTIVWLRWAAVFLLGGLLLGTLWLQQEKIAAPLSQTVKPVQKQIVPEIKIRNQSSIANAEEAKKSLFSKRKINRSANPKTIPQGLPLNIEVTEVVEDKSIAQNVSLHETLVHHEKKSQSIVLTYTLDPVETPAEILAPVVTADLPTVTAAEHKKEKSLRRMMKLASDVKNSDSPLSGLRGMKDELFALDLKKKPTGKKQ